MASFQRFRLEGVLIFPSYGANLLQTVTMVIDAGLLQSGTVADPLPFILFGVLACRLAARESYLCGPVDETCTAKLCGKGLLSLYPSSSTYSNDVGISSLSSQISFSLPVYQLSVLPLDTRRKKTGCHGSMFLSDQTQQLCENNFSLFLLEPPVLTTSLKRLVHFHICSFCQAVVISL